MSTTLGFEAIELIGTRRLIHEKAEVFTVRPGVCHLRGNSRASLAERQTPLARDLE
jgi:hypothetical protein